jgi:hypothetical protein
MRRGGAAFLVLELLACTSEPVPLSAQAGSTVLLALTDEHIFGGGVGYESPYFGFDDQRGETVLRIVGGDPRAPREIPLATRYVTRVYADPASNATLFPDLYDERLVQVLAIVDIPADTPAGTYAVRYGRRRRIDQDTYEEVAPVVPATETRLSVLPSVVVLQDRQGRFRSVRGAPTPALGYVGAGVADLAGELGRYVPHPKLVIRFQPSWDPPAGAHIELLYPAEKVEILGVFEERHPGRGSIVRWRDSDPAGRLAIDLVDPDASVDEIAVAFRLVDFLSRGRASVADFAVQASILYRADGTRDPFHSAVPTAIR